MKKKGNADDTSKMTFLLRDPLLRPFAPVLRNRHEKIKAMERHLTSGCMALADFASGHEYFGLHRDGSDWVFREWAPYATAIFLIGDFNGWRADPEFALCRISESGNWELRLPATKLSHGQLYKLSIHWPGGHGERIPAYVRRAVQDPHTKLFAAQVWQPGTVYQWRKESFRPRREAPMIYEAHVGMAQTEEKIGTYNEGKNPASCGRCRIQHSTTDGHPGTPVLRFIRLPRVQLFCRVFPFRHAGGTESPD
jgi:1,4-alpha-glucan branching enzyme